MGDGMEQNFVITEINRVILVGKNEYSQRKTCFETELNCSELIYHLSGKAIIRFNGKTLESEPDVIRFLPKGESSEYVVERTERGECIDVFFNTDFPLSPEAFTVKINENANLRNLFKKLFAVWIAKNDGYYYESMSLLYKIFAELQNKNYIPQNQYNLIKPAIEYVGKNFLGNKISVPYLAKKCGISEAYLKKLFIKRFGVPPVKYIIQLKINHACELLHSERYTITQVAELCGYSNVYYFSRQFKEYVGVTPTVFLQRYQSSK